MHEAFDFESNVEVSCMELLTSSQKCKFHACKFWFRVKGESFMHEMFDKMVQSKTWPIALAAQDGTDFYEIFFPVKSGRTSFSSVPQRTGHTTRHHRRGPCWVERPPVIPIPVKESSLAKTTLLPIPRRPQRL